MRFCNKTFTTEYKKTIGVDYLTTTKFVQELNTTICFQIWDTAGQEIYDSITRRYYKGADCALIVFSITDRESFLRIPYWKEKIITECGDIPLLIVMTKIDLDKTEEVKVTYKEAIEFSKNLNTEIIFTSSKNNIKITEMFEKLAVCYFHSLFDNEEEEYEEEENSESKRSKKEGSESNLGLINNSSEKDLKIKEDNKSFKLKVKKSDTKNENNKRKKKCCGK